MGNPKVSFAGAQHSMPAKELIFRNEPWLPQHNLGTVPKATNFFRSENHREFRHGDTTLRRTTSAPISDHLGASRVGPEASAKEDLDRAFRQAMMTSQYG